MIDHVCKIINKIENYYYRKLEMRQIKKALKDFKKGNYKTFSNIDELIDELHKE